MKLLIGRILLLFFCLSWGTVFSQEGDFRFEQFPSSVGLSQNSITATLEDHRGFLWLGTWYGLMKFDGYEVKQYKQELGNTNGLESNKITALFEDSHHRLWVGTSNSGLYLYDRESDRFISYLHKTRHNSNNNDIDAITEDSFGYLWVATEYGLIQFQPEKKQFKQFTNRPGDIRSISDNFVYSICEAPDKTLWIGTENGLNRLIRKSDGEPDYFVQYTLTPDKGLISPSSFALDNFVYKVKAVQSEPNALWIGTKAGLKKMSYAPDDFGQYELQNYRHQDDLASSLSNNFVVDIWEDPRYGLWIATFNGLNLLNIGTGDIQRFISDGDHPDVLSNNSVKSLLIDRSDNLWIGTEGGLHRLHLSAKPFNSIVPDVSENLNNKVITTIKDDSKRKGLWIGTRGGGLNYLPLSEGKVVPNKIRHFTLKVPFAPETAGFVSDIHADENGWLWISTLGSGILRVKENTVLSGGKYIKAEQRYAIQGNLENLHQEHLMTIGSTKSGDIWIGSWDKGLIRYDAQTDRFSNYKATSDGKALNAMPIVYIKEYEVNKQNFLLVATRSGGLLKLKFDQEDNSLNLVEHYQHDIAQAGSLSDNFLNYLFVDSKNRLWVGTENGLNQWDSTSNTFSYLLEIDGLSNSTIQSILEDQDGQIWISTLDGISRITEVKENSSYQIKNFDTSDNLPSGLLYAHACANTPSGELLFGGSDGLTVFQPSRIRSNHTPPKVAITDFRLFNKSVPIGIWKNDRTVLEKDIGETQDIELTHKENVISFEFVGLQFNNPQKLSYAYQLVGFDQDWIYTDSKQRIAHYTNLPYDNFLFQVKAANSDGVWSEPVSLKLSIQPPFWSTLWAYLIYLLLFLALIFGALRITKVRADLKHSLQLERLEREKLEEINQVKLSFFTNISHELRTPLTLIISPLEQFIKERRADKSLHNSFVRMYYNANRLLTMINQLLDIRKSESGLMKLKVGEGNIVKFTEEIMLSFKGLAKQRNIDLRFQTSSPVFNLWFDRDEMEKVFFNLLSNALKFTAEKGEIIMSVYEAPSPSTNRIVIEVTDNGKGIPSDQLPHVFDRFYQVAQFKDKSRQGGTGIGLALVKTIVERHHGEVKIESEENKGSSFFVSLPTGDAHFSEKEKISGFQNSESISNYHLLNGVKQQVQNLGPAISTEDLPISKDKASILIVEDNPDIRAYLRENLEPHYTITEAEDGEEGLTIALKKLPDLILADIAMPVMDGIEMCAALKSDIRASHIPIILLTARTSLIFKIDGLETGADDYVTKPFNMNLLSIRIKNLIESRLKLKEKFVKNFDLSPSGLVMNPLDEKFLNQIKRVVEKHIDDSDFSVEQLASSLFMNRMQLYRKLKALTGSTPNKVIRSFRLKRAAQLLESQQYNVSDVTYMVGYNDLKSFREQFKKEFGVSPSEYVGAKA